MEALDAIRNMDSVARATEAGLQVEVRAPYYAQPSWRGTEQGNPQVYPGWVTPEDHPVITAAVDAYRRCASPIVEETDASGGLSKEPRVARWIFSTDGVGYPIPRDDNSITVGSAKQWIESGAYKYPPMLGIGPGLEQNTHKIGECVDAREFDAVIATLARFPSALREIKETVAR